MSPEYKDQNQQQGGYPREQTQDSGWLKTTLTRNNWETFKIKIWSGLRMSKLFKKFKTASTHQTPHIRIFRGFDWLVFWITTLITLAVYLYTLAPDLTLQDCGELATASYYLGVPHAPGYPLWTVYTFLFANLIPFGNVAFRVAISSAIAAALANGLLGLMVCRGTSMLLERIELFQGIDRSRENGICMMAGIVAALLMGFNGFMWSQAVIVEVYTFSVLSFMGVLVCLFHWIYTPEKRRYLYLAAFLFGVCFTNHQTLIVAAIGIEVLIALRDPRLGRDAFAGNAIIWLLGLVLIRYGMFTGLAENGPLFILFNLVGATSLSVSIFLATRTDFRFFSNWPVILTAALLWVVGASFYFLMPLFSSTNPPMNWAYPRTWQGFIHAVTRGQYEKIQMSNIFSTRFIDQIWMYLGGADEEFHSVFLLLALVPFLFYRYFQIRERAWLIGNFAIYLCLAILLLILLNPNPDRQGRELTKVFFTPSHIIIAMYIGLGLALISGLIVFHYERFRPYFLIGGAFAVALAFWWMAVRIEYIYGDPIRGGFSMIDVIRGLKQTLANIYPTPPVMCVLAGVYVILLATTFTVFVVFNREVLLARYFLVIFALIPVYAFIAHWAENEQRGHLFGFWFGHDMFKPPFDIYPPMAKNAILFGGTDPGRFCPTYMIFCESFIDPQDRRDPDFDRRDVYIITQNALADNTYLAYIRAHYNRSKQNDPPFLMGMIEYFADLALPKELRRRKMLGEPIRRVGISKTIIGLTNLVAPIDKLILNFGAKVEKRRRINGVYPPKEIDLPTDVDLQQAFYEYTEDAYRRKLANQLKPGEQVIVDEEGKVQVAGQISVMGINAILAKMIFDRNPQHEFYLEESFPMDWMNPHLLPYGIIMKIERDPVKEFTQDIIDQDHKFWRFYSNRLCGDVISYETSMEEISQLVDKFYRKGNLQGYKGNTRFIRDDDAQKAFSKLRGAIARVYAWRAVVSTNGAEKARLIKEAEFAYKQSFMFCPYSAEAVSGLVNLFVMQGRFSEARIVVETALRFDPGNAFFRAVYIQLVQLEQAAYKEKALSKTSTNLETFLEIRNKFLEAQKRFYESVKKGDTNQACGIVQALCTQEDMPVELLIMLAQDCVSVGRYDWAEFPLAKAAERLADVPEIWYDLAGAQLAGGKTNQAIASLKHALMLYKNSPEGRTNLYELAQQDVRFNALRNLPEFKQLLEETKP